MIRLKELLLSEAPFGGDNPLDGKSKTNAKNLVIGKVKKFTNGFFSDEYWRPVNQVFKEFERLHLNWVGTGATYEQERVELRDHSHASVPIRKIWTFEIKFRNNRDKPDVLFGRIVAAGAGPVESPLDRYDVTLTVS